LQKGGELMKQKIKKIAVYVSSMFFTLLPVVAMAQLTIPGGTGLPGEGGTSIYAIIQNIMRWLLALLGFIAVIGFVISGILYLTAAGDEDAQARAKRAMIYSITGVIVGLVGLVILYAAGRLLSAQQNF
jgi:cytochrome bd-type quinol oxidase subunit 2